MFPTAARQTKRNTFALLRFPVNLDSAWADRLSVTLSSSHFAYLTYAIRLGLPVALRHVNGFPVCGLLGVWVTIEPYGAT